MRGTLYLVVGPSGVGKDTLIDGAREALSGETNVVFARRVITRQSDAGGENHEYASDGQFETRRGSGDFMLDWEAHGFKYAIPASYYGHLDGGRSVIANVSRSVIKTAIANCAPAVVLEISASPDILADRLKHRKRETEAEIRKRLSRQAAMIPETANKVKILNDGTPQDAVAEFIRALNLQAPKSKFLMSRKFSGHPLNYDDYSAVIKDIVEGRYDDQQIADFLVSVSKTLAIDETVDLAKARADFSASIDWGNGRIVDKHSMGGVPGSRISMIVIPIVAAHGLIIPKTSSRAITSPAGTADTMEVLARVDLNVDDVRRVVRATNGCIAWNGRLNHSRVDEVMNRITRPLEINTLNWSVASILSKKIAAGTTHCIIDIPLGPSAKVQSADDAKHLKNLFIYVGNALGLEIEVKVTDGSAPIGRGIGPALEARDIISVLRNDRNAPADLREKSLSFASTILAYDPNTTKKAATTRARELLGSGAAWEKFERICAAQGPPPEKTEIGSYTTMITAEQNSRVTSIDCFELSAIARAAGAPKDKGAGVDLLAQPGDEIRAGQPLYRIHASDNGGLTAARIVAARNNAFRLQNL